MEEGLRRELARVARDIEVIFIINIMHHNNIIMIMMMMIIIIIKVLERKEVELRNEVATITRCFQNYKKFGPNHHQLFSKTYFQNSSRSTH